MQIAGRCASWALRRARRAEFAITLGVVRRRLRGVALPLTTVAMLAAAWVGMGAGVHANESARVAIGVRLNLDRSVASRIRKDILEDEIAGIWSPYGVELDWTDAAASATAAGGLSLEAIVERRIAAPELPDRFLLGRTAVAWDRALTEPIRASFEATESVLALRTLRLGSSVEHVHDRDVARALGRVLAHEIGHVLLGAPYHDRIGLMRAAFNPDELAELGRARFRLPCNEIARLRFRLRLLTGDLGSAGSQEPSGEALEHSRAGSRSQPDRAACIAAADEH